MQQIEFSKYQGTGNDFILIDGFHNKIPQLTEKNIQEMCHRRFGIGADGLIILKPKDGYDFDMDFYNSDGKNGSMCGNGGRCVVAFAHDIDVIKSKTTFWAPDGEHYAEFDSYKKVALKMQNVKSIEQHELGLFMDTGSPHLVNIRDNISSINSFEEGRKIRYSIKYASEGVNVNFTEISEHNISLITYERGVEDTTYSCGTGTVAAAIASHLKTGLQSPIKAETKGGSLEVSFKQINDQNFEDIWLIGPATKTYSGIFML